MQKQYPDLPQQAPPHEIASAVEAAEAKPDTTADAAHAPEPAPNRKHQGNQQLKEGSTEPGGITFSTRW